MEDYEYITGGDPYCTGSFCCRKKGLFKAGEFGTPTSPRCDIPTKTFVGTLEFVRDYPVDPSKILGVFSNGDSAAHDAKTQTQELNIDHVKTVYKLFDQYLTETKKMPVFGTLGNHDSFPLDHLDYRPGGAFLLDVLPDFWKPWLEETALTTVKEYGMYSQSLGHNLTVISLNMFWVDTGNPYIKNYPNRTHFLSNWLDSELEKVQKQGGKAIIIGHFSPGVLGPYIEVYTPEDWHVTDEWNDDFVQISKKYQNTILMQLSGHEHVDRYITVKDENDNPTSMCFVIPAVTVLPFSNPTARLFKIDVSTGSVVDMLTFINDVSKSNADGKMEGNWKLEYSMKDLYGLTGAITPKNLQTQVIDKISTDDDAYKVYMKNHFSQYMSDWCDGDCKKKLLCSMNYVTKERYKDCVSKS